MSYIFCRGEQYSLSLVNLLINYSCHLAVLSRRLSDNVNWNSCIHRQRLLATANISCSAVRELKHFLSKSRSLSGLTIADIEIWYRSGSDVNEIIIHSSEHLVCGPLNRTLRMKINDSEEVYECVRTWHALASLESSNWARATLCYRELRPAFLYWVDL